MNMARNFHPLTIQEICQKMMMKMKVKKNRKVNSKKVSYNHKLSQNKECLNSIRILNSLIRHKSRKQILKNS